VPGYRDLVLDSRLTPDWRTVMIRTGWLLACDQAPTGHATHHPGKQESQALDPLDLVVSLAETGRLGPLRCGMTLAEVQEVLGPFHDRIPQSKPRRWKPRLHFWDDLELLICHGMVVAIGLPLWRDTVGLPPAVGGWDAPRPAMLPLAEVIGALEAAGCGWREAPEEVLDAAARAVRILDSGVVLAFWLDEGGIGVMRLGKVHKADYGVDQNDHSPGQGRATVH
jgi:hypothetical protein